VYLDNKNKLDNTSNYVYNDLNIQFIATSNMLHDVVLALNVLNGGNLIY
jgi:hypothetical protein